jgi:hypothetical protein
MDGVSSLMLLAPAALLGLVTLAIPLLIHLFSRSKGRKVLIGHIDLVRNARRRRVTEIRLTQWLLLILRLLIFALAAFILAQLARQGLADRPGDVAYLTRGWALAAGPDALDTVREANPGGVFLLEPGFPAVEELPGASTPITAARLSNAWPLLAERLSVEQHSGQVTVYTTGLALELGANLPDHPGEVAWEYLEQPPVVSPLPMPRVLLVHEPQLKSDAGVVGAALDGITRHRLPGLTWERRALDGSAIDTTGFDRIIVLGDHRTAGALRTNSVPAESVLHLQEVPRNADFPDELLHMLLGERGYALSWPESRVPVERLERARLGVAPGQPPTRSLQAWLAALIIALWAAERWLCERGRSTDG